MFPVELRNPNQVMGASQRMIPQMEEYILYELTEPERKELDLENERHMYSVIKNIGMDLLKKDISWKQNAFKKPNTLRKPKNMQMKRMMFQNFIKKIQTLRQKQQ